MSRLKELRKEKGYTQLKIQMLTGIDRSVYSKLENGKRTMNTYHCMALATALHTSMDYLLQRTDVKTPYQRKN